MNVEKLFNVAVDVRDLDEATKFFSDLLGITFECFQVRGNPGAGSTYTEHADRAYEERITRVAIDPTGFFELVEQDPPVEREGLRSIHLKVSNLAHAMAEMEQKGIRRIAYEQAGRFRQALYSPEDLHGVRLNLSEFDAPNMLAAIGGDEHG